LVLTAATIGELYMDMEATKPTLPTKTLRIWCVWTKKLDKHAVKPNNVKTGSTNPKANLCKKDHQIAC